MLVGAMKNLILSMDTPGPFRCFGMPGIKLVLLPGRKRGIKGRKEH